MHGWDLDTYAERARAFGWHTVVIDGHDVDAVDAAYHEAVSAGRPTAIVARTLKGKGVKAVENIDGAHGKPLSDADEAIAELGGDRNLTVSVPGPSTDAAVHVFESTTAPDDAARWKPGDEVATRRAYGDALAALARRRTDVVALDGEVGNSTYAEIFAEAHPERYFEMYIAEQQMVAAAVGMQVRGWRPFVSSFAAFMARPYDFVRMAAISRARLALCGSHAGVSIGEDGPSQMGLEDLATMRAIHGSLVLYPCDANQTAALVAHMADHDGISYLRTTRGATAVIYDADDAFPVGGSRVLRSSDADQVTVVAAGITVHEALEAAKVLEAEGVAVRLVDAYSVKPIDAGGLREAAAATDGRIVTVEDHWAEGGLGDAVASSLAESGSFVHLVKLAVREMPTSGKPDERVTAAGIDADHIADAARKLVS